MIDEFLEVCFPIVVCNLKLYRSYSGLHKTIPIYYCFFFTNFFTVMCFFFTDYLVMSFRSMKNMKCDNNILSVFFIIYDFTWFFIRVYSYMISLSFYVFTEKETLWQHSYYFLFFSRWRSSCEKLQKKMY